MQLYHIRQARTSIWLKAELKRYYTDNLQMMLHLRAEKQRSKRLKIQSIVDQEQDYP
jgi:hypothetical protein